MISFEAIRKYFTSTTSDKPIDVPNIENKEEFIKRTQFLIRRLSKIEETVDLLKEEFIVGGGGKDESDRFIVLKSEITQAKTTLIRRLKLYENLSDISAEEIRDTLSDIGNANEIIAGKMIECQAAIVSMMNLSNELGDNSNTLPAPKVFISKQKQLVDKKQENKTL